MDFGAPRELLEVQDDPKVQDNPNMAYYPEGPDTL